MNKFWLFLIISISLNLQADSLLEKYQAIYLKSAKLPLNVMNISFDNAQDYAEENDEILNEEPTEMQVEILFAKFKKLGDAWGKCQVTLDCIKTWSSIEQRRLNIQTSETVIYPFGGGDIVYPMSFFPDFKQMVIIGLESVGKGFSLQDSASIVNNLVYLFNHGNFVTRDMEAFAKTGGIFTIILIQLVKQSVKNLTYKISNSSIEFNFIWQDKPRKIIYYKMNLHDDNIAAWGKLFDNYKNFTLFMKSASFVPQQVGFKKIRDMLVENANVILQDDTGIAYNILQKNGFTIEVYGEYYLRYTIRGLEGFFQDDLKEAYSKKQPELLPFGIGYRSEILPGNILWAYKQI